MPNSLYFVCFCWFLLYSTKKSYIIDIKRQGDWKNMENNLMVLLVEDDENACEELRKYINQTPDICLQNVTNNSEEALSMVRAGLPDAVILDLELHYGGGNGLLFLDGLKRLHLSLPIIPALSRWNRRAYWELILLWRNTNLSIPRSMLWNF